MIVIDNDTSTNVTYSISVTQLNTAKVDGISKVVSHVQWKITAVDNQTGKSVFMTGTTPFQLETITWNDSITKRAVTVEGTFDKENYIPYEELSEEIVVEWVKNHPLFADFGKIKEALKERLGTNLSNTANQDLPWV